MTKEEFNSFHHVALATLCQQVVDCPDTPEETVKKARQLRSELLLQYDALPSRKKENLNQRVADFLFKEQMFLKIGYETTSDRGSDITP
jgi:hypothetical protein